MIKGTSTISSNTTIVLYSVNLCVSLDLFIGQQVSLYLVNPFIITVRAIRVHPPHHWCSPPAPLVFTARTICANPLHQIISQTVKYGLLEV